MASIMTFTAWGRRENPHARHRWEIHDLLDTIVRQTELPITFSSRGCQEQTATLKAKVERLARWHFHGLRAGGVERASRM